MVTMTLVVMVTIIKIFPPHRALAIWLYNSLSPSSMQSCITHTTNVSLWVQLCGSRQKGTSVTTREANVIHRHCLLQTPWRMIPFKPALTLCWIHFQDHVKFGLRLVTDCIHDVSSYWNGKISCSNLCILQWLFQYAVIQPLAFSRCTSICACIICWDVCFLWKSTPVGKAHVSVLCCLMWC